jgi:hypothetical protein
MFTHSSRGFGGAENTWRSRFSVSQGAARERLAAQGGLFYGMSPTARQYGLAILRVGAFTMSVIAVKADGAML